MTLRLQPISLQHLSEGSGLLWPHLGQWRLYQLHQRWQDGALLTCLHTHHPHRIFVQAHQWVVGLQALQAAEWLGALGPSWETPTIQVALHGGSMHPTIPTPATLTIAPYQPGRLCVGQVIVWAQAGAQRQEKGRWIAHRLKAIRSDPTKGRVLVAAGDGNRWDDPPLCEHQILGVVVSATHRGIALDPHSLQVQLVARCRWQVRSLRQTLGRVIRH